MAKSFTRFLFLLGTIMALSAVGPLAAEENTQETSETITTLRLAGSGIAARAEQLLQRATDGGRLFSSSDDAGAKQTAKKKDGRKAMWITIAASAVGVALAVKFAPEAEIPTTPSYGAYKCTSFYRPGGLVTTSGYTCVPR